MRSTSVRVLLTIGSASLLLCSAFTPNHRFVTPSRNFVQLRRNRSCVRESVTELSCASTDGDGEKSPTSNSDANETAGDKVSVSKGDVEEPEFMRKIGEGLKKISDGVSLPNILFGAVVGVVIAFAALFSPFVIDLSEDMGPSTTSSSSITKSLNNLQSIQRNTLLFGDILEDINAGYVDPIDPTKLFETAVSSMLKSLDPYTEFENLGAARTMQESVSGKYGGVGLIISGNKIKNMPILPSKPDVKAKETTEQEGKKIESPSSKQQEDSESATPGAGDTAAPKEGGEASKVQFKGIAVVDAFEGYGYDCGLRVGDRIVSVGGVDTTEMNVEQVRDLLRGDPDTDVKIVFDRDENEAVLKKKTTGTATARRGVSSSGNDISGGEGSAAPTGAGGEVFDIASALDDSSNGNGALPSTDGAVITLGSAESYRPSDPVPSPLSPSAVRREVTIKRRLVRMSDVKLATFLGDPKDGIGYINLSGFNAGAGRDFRQAMLMLRFSEPQDLQGLILDLRGNPGGLLDAAVEIAGYLLPSESEVVSAKGRTGPEIVYTTNAVSEPIRPPNMKLAVLVNSGSASASEIVSGAIQDYDAGIIVGPSRTFGKGLVQKIIPLAYDNALKFTTAKYYTPSGRCIQSVAYTGGRDTSASGSTSTSTSASSSDGVAVPESGSGKDAGSPGNGADGNTGEGKGDGILNKGTDSSPAAPESPEPLLNMKQLDNGIYAAKKQMGPDSDNIAPTNLMVAYAPASADASSNANAFADTDTLVARKAPSLFAYDDRPRKQARPMPSNNQQPSNPNKPGSPNREGDGYGDLGDGAYEISDADRKVFYTRAGRPVRDGGGIEPDLKTEKLIPGPAETIFLTQGVYFDFISEYLVDHNIRPYLREAAETEKRARGVDERFQIASQYPMGSMLNQYFVLNEPILYNPDLTVPVMPEKTARASNSAGSSSSTGAGAGSSSSSSSSSAKTVVKGKEAVKDRYDELYKDLFWVKLDGGKVGGKSSGVTGAAAARRAELFRDFKRYVKTHIAKGDINVEGDLERHFQELRKDLEEDGLVSVIPSIESLRPKVRESIFKDMEKNREQIINDLEITLLSRELPDRLLLFRNIVQDPQVRAARDVLRESILIDRERPLTMRAAADTVAGADSTAVSAADSGAGAGAGVGAGGRKTDADSAIGSGSSKRRSGYYTMNKAPVKNVNEEKKPTMSRYEALLQPHPTADLTTAAANAAGGTNAGLTNSASASTAVTK